MSNYSFDAFENILFLIFLLVFTGRPMTFLNTTEKRQSWWFPVMATSSEEPRPPSVEC